MTKKILILLLIIGIQKPLFAQNDTKEFFYNISIGGVFGAVGALINKKPEQKAHIVIAKGLAQGALGGYVTYESKRLLRVAQKNEDWKIIWSAKLLNAAGTSIKENAAANEDFWNKWHLNLGFNRIEFQTNDQFRIGYKVQPIALAYTIDAFFRFDKFEAEKSLQTGEFIFSSKNLNNNGATLAGYFVLNPNTRNNYKTITHEIIHLYQSNDFSVLNVYLNKPIENLNKKSKTLEKINRFVHYDFHYIPLRALYLSEGSDLSNYYENFFEHEAGYYSGTLH